MLRKNCKACGKNSFSASEHRLWLCPYCNCDLTKEKSMNANDLKTVLVEEAGTIQTKGRQENN